MKKHWKGINRASASLKKHSSTCGLIFRLSLMMIIIGGLTFCKPRNSDENTVDDRTLLEDTNDSSCESNVTDTITNTYSEFQFDNTMTYSNGEDEYNDRFDEYLDDPEDELRFDPEIFDFQDD